MARLKRGSAVLNKAMRRMAGMRSIRGTLVFGDGLSLANYDARIQDLQVQLGNYNTMLSTLDEMAGQIALMEQDLRNYSEKMLMSVAVQYGKDSLQYMQAGGTPRKRTSRRSTTAPAPNPTVAESAIVETATINGNGAKVTISG